MDRLFDCTMPDQLSRSVSEAKKEVFDLTATAKSSDQENLENVGKQHYNQLKAKVSRLKFNHNELQTKLHFLTTLKESKNIEKSLKRMTEESGDRYKQLKTETREIKKENEMLQNEIESGIQTIVDEKEEILILEKEIAHILESYSEGVKQYRDFVESETQGFQSNSDVIRAVSEHSGEKQALTENVFELEKQRDELLQTIQELNSKMREAKIKIRGNIKKMDKNLNGLTMWYKSLLDLHAALSGIRIVEIEDQSVALLVTHNLPIDNPLVTEVSFVFSVDTDSVESIKVKPEIPGVAALVESVKQPSDISPFLIRLQRLIVPLSFAKAHLS